MHQRSHARIDAQPMTMTASFMPTVAPNPQATIPYRPRDNGHGDDVPVHAPVDGHPLVHAGAS
jgi:hypothetical protein